MGCLCFGGGKQDLTDLSAPIDPAVPKPKSASGNAGAAGSSTTTPNGQAAPVPPPPPAELRGPQRSESAPRGSQSAVSGDDGAPAAGGRLPRAHTDTRPRPLVIPSSPTCPPAQPKAGGWNVSPNQQQAEQVEDADVEDIDVDLEDVQELSPIPTASATPASRPTSLNGGGPTPPFGLGRFQQSPSNLGPGRSSGAAVLQGPDGRNGAGVDEEAEEAEEPEEEDVRQFSGELESTPGASPTALIYSERSPGPFEDAPGGPPDDGQQQQQQSAQDSGARRSELGQQQHTFPSFVVRHSTGGLPVGGEGAGGGGEDGDGLEDTGGDGDGGGEGAEQRPQHIEGQGKEEEREEQLATEGERQGQLGKQDSAAAGSLDSSPALDPEQQRSRGQSARRTAAGPYAPTKPSPLGNGVRRGGVRRQDSGRSDGSDLSLPGEYERYGAGSSDEDEVADMQYEQALTAAGGQVAPGATSRGSSVAAIAGGPVPAPEPLTASPRAASSSRTSVFENSIWRENLEEEEEANLLTELDPLEPLLEESAGELGGAVKDKPSPKGDAGRAAKQATKKAPQRAQSSRHASEDGSDRSRPGSPARRSKSGSASTSASRPRQASSSAAKSSPTKATSFRTISGRGKVVRLSTGGEGDALALVNEDVSELASSSSAGGKAGALSPAARTLQMRSSSSNRSLKTISRHSTASGTAPEEVAAPWSPISETPEVKEPRSPTADDTLSVLHAATHRPSAISDAPSAQGEAHDHRTSATSDRAFSSTPGVARLLSSTSETPSAPPEAMPPQSPTSAPTATAPAVGAGDDGAVTGTATPVDTSLPPAAKLGHSASVLSSASSALPAGKSASATTTATQRTPASPSTASFSGLPRFMQPTRSAVAHRRASEDGHTPVSGGMHATTVSAASTATSAAGAAASTTAATPTATSRLLGTGKSPSTAVSTAAARSNLTAPTASSAARAAAVRHSIGTPVTALKPPAPATAAAATGGQGSGAKLSAAAAKPSGGAAAGKAAAAAVTGSTSAKSAVKSATPVAKAGAAAPSGKAAAASAPSSRAASGARGPLTEGSEGVGSLPSPTPAEAAAAAAEARLEVSRSGPQPKGAFGHEAAHDGLGAATATPRPAAPDTMPAGGGGGGGGGGLPFGEWRMVRLKKEMPCCASEGTVAQETNDGQKEVFKCEETLPVGGLAAVISHSFFPPGDGSSQPKTWIFCPDPLCMESKPVGSDLPPWPEKIILAGGVRVTRSEYDNLKSLGLDVTLPAKPSTASTS